jgi:hypothetical protein
MRRWVLAGALGLLAAASGAAVITFADATVGAGLGEHAFLSYAVTVADIDADLDLDIMVWGGDSSENQMFRNDGAAHFEDITSQSGMGFPPLQLGEYGGPFHTFDNRALPSVYDATVHPNFSNVSLFYRNTNGLFFEEVGAALGVRDPVDRAGPAWADVNSDGFLDFYVGTAAYIDSPVRPALFMNRSGQGFVDEREQRGLSFHGNSWVHLWFDWEEDGDPDLFIGAYLDYAVNMYDRLFRNDGTGHFTDATATAFPASAERTVAADLADFDGDGHLDLFVLHEFAPNFVWRDNGDGTFTDIAPALGLAMPTPPGSEVSKGQSVVADFDNDMDPDVFLVRFTPYLGEEVRYELWLNEGGTYVERGTEAGLRDRENSGACAAGDMNGDGFLDVYVANWTGFGARDTFYLNNGNANHWIEIDPRGVLSNRDAVGLRAWVTAGGKTQVQELYSTMSLPNLLHFGLGPNTVVTKLRLRWPSGLSESYSDVPADQVFRPIEGASLPWEGMGLILR